MLRFVSDHLKTKNLCKNYVKKLPFVIKYVPDLKNTQEMCEKVILKNDGTLKSANDCFKNQKNV